jgi:hypothetical protein
MHGGISASGAIVMIPLTFALFETDNHLNVEVLCFSLSLQQSLLVCLV